MIGGGPSGFYLAKQLLSKVNCIVHIYEKLPFPFGLIRYGVAPDHQNIKNVSKEFQTVDQFPNFRFFGNVLVGRDLSCQYLHDNYSAIIYAYGAECNTTPNERISAVQCRRR